MPGHPAHRGPRGVLATEQSRTALVAHVHAAKMRHGIPLPTDVPPDLLD